MKQIVLAFVILVGLMFACTTFVDYANSKEPTTLDDALERPVKIKKFVDKPNGVVCYWADRYPKHISCVNIDKK